MEFVVAVLVVIVILEGLVIYRFKRRADLLKETMERDRATLMRTGHPPGKGRPPEPTVAADRGPRRAPPPRETPAAEGKMEGGVGGEEPGPAEGNDAGPTEEDEGPGPERPGR